MGFRRAGDGLAGTDTYATIVRAGRKLFRDNGYAMVTVDDLRRAAQISRATFYFYFASKNTLFLAVADQLMNEMYSSAAELDSGTGAFDIIVRSNALYINHVRRETKILSDFLALSMMDDSFRHSYSQYTRRFQARIERRVRTLVDRNEIPTVDPRLTAIALIAMIQMFSLRFFRESDIVEVDNRSAIDALRTVSEMWYRMLYGSPAPPDYCYERYLDLLCQEPPLVA